MKRILSCVIVVLMLFLSVGAHSYDMNSRIIVQPMVLEEGYNVGDSFGMLLYVGRHKASYQWYMRWQGFSDFVACTGTGAQTDNLWVTMTEALDGAQFYCAVTFAEDGEVVNSDILTVRLKGSPTPTPEPTPTASPEPTATSALGSQEPDITTTATPAPETTPTPIPSLDDEVEGTPFPSPTIDPNAEHMSFEDELLTHVGEIEGMIVFGVVVLLCFFAYKFFRIFF